MQPSQVSYKRLNIPILVNYCVYLILWSGRRGSNPLRPAWEFHFIRCKKRIYLILSRTAPYIPVKMFPVEAAVHPGVFNGFPEHAQLVFCKSELLIQSVFCSCCCSHRSTGVHFMVSIPDFPFGTVVLINDIPKGNPIINKWCTI